MRGSKSYARYERYKAAQTVRQLLALGAFREDLRHDAKKGFVGLLWTAAPPAKRSASAAAPPTALPTALAPSQRIRLVQGNPKRQDTLSHTRYERYKARGDRSRRTLRFVK